MVNILKRGLRRQNPRIPAGLRFYVIGDVHGRVDALRDVFSRIDADRTRSSTVRPVQLFLGDYVDRGPASREVLDLLSMRLMSHEMVLLRGNHEVMFHEFFSNPVLIDNWRQYGGLQTLISYGLKPSIKPSPAEAVELSQNLAIKVPRLHRQLISKMPSSFTCGDFYFVHAGVRPGTPLKEQKDEDLLWIREDFLLYERDFEKFIVHGHTPVLKPDVRSNRINLDVGAYATGNLACLVIDGETIDFI